MDKKIGSPWLATAYEYIGVAEIPGPKTSPIIGRWLQKLHAWWADDETPWCGVFVAHCIQAAGLALPKNWMRAKAWAEWGIRLAQPVTGCVVVFERQGGGHVGFVAGRTLNGNLIVLGGNQSNQVKLSEFGIDRVVGYYWPADTAPPMYQGLVVMDSAGALSGNEA